MNFHQSNFSVVFFPWPWTISLKVNTPLIHSTPFLNIVPNGICLQGSYDMFVIPPSFEVLGHHANIDSSSMSKTALSSVPLQLLYDWRKGTKYTRVGHIFQYTKISLLPMHMQLHFRIPWRNWWENTVQNTDMNAFHYIFLSSKGSL